MTGESRFVRWLRRSDWREALELIDRDGCENYTNVRCFDRPHRMRGAKYTAEAWCAPCIARKALDDA